MEDAVVRALELLTAEARRQWQQHPWSHLTTDRRSSVDLDLQLPVYGATDLGSVAERLREALSNAVDTAVTHQALFRPGHVYCLRCAGAECEHSTSGDPPDPRKIFAGFGPTGIPKYMDLGQLLLERGDPEVDLLFRERPGFVARILTERELTGDLLDAYRDRRTGYRLHGQVVAGWYLLPDAGRQSPPVALTVQVVSSRGSRGKGRGHRGGARRYGLSILAAGPGGEPVEMLYDRLRQPPWTEALRWAQGVLQKIEADLHRRRGRRNRPQAVQGRIEGLLNGLARRLEKARRARGRRTQHAQKRHQESDRPTEMALADLRNAGRDNLLYDTRHETLIALGERGRAHVFNLEGKHVTSIRYSPPAIEKRKQQGRWRPANEDELAGLQKRMGVAL